MEEYLKVTEIINWQDPDVLSLAQQLATLDTISTAKACFEWVRDYVYHSSDYKMSPVTCRASDVLQHKTGFCYGKSHLLAALLRGNSIPTGFCYQRLSVFDDGSLYSLHGFNAVYLPQYGWYRIDARGNKPGVDAQFTPPREQLAFGINFAEEIDCQHIFANPLPEIIKALQTHHTWQEILHNLPDVSRDYLASYQENINTGRESGDLTWRSL